MKIMNIQHKNNTTFGTKYGKNLTKLLDENKDKLSTEQIVNISKIRNNGINTVLEIENASSKDKDCI